MIDFDYNATTPLKESVRESMSPYLNGEYGNPSSIHQIGQRTKAAVEEARDAIADSVNADPESLVLTGSGSEANTLAIRGYLPNSPEDVTVVTTPVEHSSVRDTMHWLENNGATVKKIDVNAEGQLDLDSFEEKLSGEVDLVSVMSVNNETGVRYPIEDIGELCRERDITLHTDAVQAYGKVPLDFAELPVDMLAVSAHKIGGPKGVGALFAPKSIDLDPLIFGGHQERDRRGGTENVAGVVGFGKAASEIDPEEFQLLASKRDRFETYLTENLEDCLVVGGEAERVANTSGLVIGGVEGEDVVMRMDLDGYAIATGAACTSGSAQPSHVIDATPLPEGFSPGSFVRFSFAPDQSEQTLLEGARRVEEIVRDLRETDVSSTYTETMVTES